jgi:uncharacterized protein YbgA (DUF1722 family)/uncharacterized protein YbbK (DUF523 family)
METPIRVGVSACLLGARVRYDGGDKLDRWLRDTLGPFVSWVPVCPEVECGLPVPREAMRLVGDPADPRLVTVRTGVDHTAGMQAWSGRRLDELERGELCGFVFKSRSPSSGMRQVKVHGGRGAPPRSGVGIFARAFMERFPLLPVEDEGRLQDPDRRASFIERLFVFARWQAYLREDGSARGLVDFHTRHKLLILAHGTTHYAALGRLVAGAGQPGLADLRRRYLETLMAGLRLPATRRKHTNVLQHAAGYFKKQLSPAEKRELQEAIAAYHGGLVSLVLPVTLLARHAGVHEEPYLARQLYLAPDPRELALRNHA